VALRCLTTAESFVVALSRTVLDIFSRGNPMWLPGDDTWVGPYTMVLTIIDETRLFCAPDFHTKYVIIGISLTKSEKA
jgi:hypothetical protein